MAVLKFALALVAALWLAIPAQAQFVPETGSSTPQAVPEPSPNDVREFLRLLGDPSVQKWISENAQSQVEATGSAQRNLREQFDLQRERVADRVQSLVLAWEMLPQVPDLTANAWNTELSHAQKVRSVTYILTFLLIGFGLEWLYRQMMQYPLLRLEQTPKDAPWDKFVGACTRAAIIFAGLGVFAIGSIGAFEMFDWHPLVEILVLDLLVMVLLYRSLTTMSLFLQAPRAAELRLVPYDTAAAKFLHNIVRVLAFTIAGAFAVSFLLTRLTELEASGFGARLEAVALAHTVVLAIIVVAVTTACIWISFKRLPHLCDLSAEPRTLKIWRNYLLVLVLAVFALWLAGAFFVMWTVLIAGVTIPGVRLLKAWIDHFFDQSTEALHNQHMAEAQVALDAFLEAEQDGTLMEGEPQPETPEFADPYVTWRPIIQRGARFVFLMTAVLVLSATWGLDVFDLSADRSIGGRILKVLIDSIVALLLADLVWTWAKTVIDKRLADYEPPVDGQAPGPEARMVTLLPLLRTILLVTLLIMVGLSILSAAGVNIAPILAGAGIVGIAIGFGTQSLVRDIVSGIFFLIDDAFRIGEYIEVGDLMGTVESISVRSMRIRHHRGKVHTVPYGELKSLTNHSRDWVIMKLEFRVPFDTDLQLVKKLIKKVGAELQANEHYGASILSTLKSQGVRRMEEFNMVVGVKFMTKPGEQWLVRRDAYQKVRDIFEANGIRMAERNVKVEIEGNPNLTEEQRQAVAGAAQEAVQGPAGPPKPIPDEP